MQCLALRGARVRHAIVGMQINLLVFDRPPQTFDEHVVPPRDTLSRHAPLPSRGAFWRGACRCDMSSSARAHRERQVQAAARRIGLKLIGLKPIVDGYNADHADRKRYYLRPIWDARHVVRVLPSGGYEMARRLMGISSHFSRTERSCSASA